MDRAKAAAVLERILGPTREGRPSQFAVFISAQALEPARPRAADPAREKILRAQREGAPARTPPRLIGYCGFFHQIVGEQEEIDIAYRLHPSFWGRAMPPKQRRRSAIMLRDLKLARVISLVHPDNHASARVAVKNGMRIEKFTDFRGYPANVFVITRHAWAGLTKTAYGSRDTR